MAIGKRTPFYVLDAKYETLAIVDVYISSIWTERYWECGDFELQIPFDRETKDLFKKDRYLARSDSKRLMVVENLEVTYDAENGDVLKVSGRSAESLLTRRIIWGFVTVRGNLDAVVTKLMTENAVSPSDEKRRLPGISLITSGLTVGSIDAQYLGEELYSTIETLCKNESIGFKMELIGDRLTFRLYEGVDHSYEQTENDYVVFSSEFGNLVSSTELMTDTPLKNVCLIAGEGEGPDRKIASTGNFSGLARREIYSDGSSISQKTGEKDPETDEDIYFSDEEYASLLQQHGKEELAKHPATDDFDAEVNPNSSFRYGVDYQIGDIVSIVSPYSENRKARVTEYIRSSDENGVSEYPTFQILEQEV